MSTAETTHPLSWLSAICTPDRPGKDDVRAHPWLLYRKDRWQLVATDGRLLVALDSPDASNTPEATDRLRQTILGVMEMPLPPVRGRSDAADLTVWCGPYDPGEEEPCEACAGGGRCECPRCEGDHDCGVCEGSGVQGPTPPCRPGSLDGRRVDRNRLAKAVSHLAGPCEIRAAQDRLALVGAGWLVLLAPLTDAVIDEDESEFTAWQTKSLTGV
jgi:hypothetical protein